MRSPIKAQATATGWIQVIYYKDSACATPDVYTDTTKVDACIDIGDKDFGSFEYTGYDPTAITIAYNQYIYKGCSNSGFKTEADAIIEVVPLNTCIDTGAYGFAKASYVSGDNVPPQAIGTPETSTIFR